MKLEYYEAIIARLSQDYGVSVDREHSHIHEFFEGPIPLFKLILSEGEMAQAGIMLASFHIDLDSTAAIQWFMRIRQLDPNLHITACYLRDAEGGTHVGEDAAILRQYMLEQDVVNQWILGDKDAEEQLNEKLPIPPPSPLKTFQTYKAAFLAFQKMQKKKGEVSH